MDPMTQPADCPPDDVTEEASAVHSGDGGEPEIEI
jgi:hypothetical protein